MCHPRWTKPSHINHHSRQHPTDLPTGQNLNTIFSIKIPSSGARERAEQFRVLVALEKALGLIHGTHNSLQSFVTSVPGNLIPSYGTHGHKSCMWHTDVHAGKTSPIPHPQHTAYQAWVWWYTSITLALGKMRQEDQESDVSLQSKSLSQKKKREKNNLFSDDMLCQAA